MCPVPRGIFARTLACCAAALILAACGSAGTQPLPGATPSAAPASAGPATASASFTLEIPIQTAASAQQRGPLYISNSTDTVSVVLLSASAGLPTPNNPQTLSVSPGTAPCDTTANADYYACTIAVRLPIGTDGIRMQTLAAGTVISQQQVTVPVLQGAANSGATNAAYNLTLDAVPGAPLPIPNFGNNTGGFNVQFPPNCSTGGVNVLERDAASAIINSMAAGIPTLTASSNNTGAVSVHFISESSGESAYSITTGASGTANVTFTESPASAGDGIGAAADVSTVLVVTISNAATCPT